MSFISEQPCFESELDNFYATYPVDISSITEGLTQQNDAHPEWSSYRRKAALYTTAAEQIDVQVFRHCPFYFELKSGRQRTRWGFDGIGGWLKDYGYGREYQQKSGAWKTLWQSFVTFNGMGDTDLDHHCLGYDNILRLGLDGISAKAQKRLKTVKTDKQKDFLQSIVSGCDALTCLAKKFSRRATEMLATETDPVIQARLQRVANSAAKVPAAPPETFFEALNTLIFMREAIGSLEGIGVSTFGHLDRMLLPYYEADLAAGRLTRKEAEDLLYFFLAITDVKFETKRAYHETSTTVFIGGCDAQGNVVFNDISRMIIKVYKDLRLANPKFQARISPEHPEEYFDLLADFVAAGTNVIAIYNDPVLIAANTQVGKALEDARLYVGGGCQENILQNTEISNRATMFMSLPAILEMGFFPERWEEFRKTENLELKAFADCQTFDEFYQAFLANLRAVTDRLVANRNRYEAEGWRYNPCPLHSSTIDDCIENAKDMTEGGCRYSTGSVDLAGIGTVVDSLYCICKVVYERGEIPLRQMIHMLETNYEGEEAFRQYLLNKITKFGRDDEEMKEFNTKAFADIARASSGQKNSRGGTYAASLFSHYSSTRHGWNGGATPDGRKAGSPYSKSMGPSTESLGKKNSIGAVLREVDAVDLIDYPVTSVLDVKLPQIKASQALTTVKPVIKRFIEVGGSVLQINTIDEKMLKEAYEDPTAHPDLLVRVTGYSAYFHTLSRNTQAEILERTELAY